MQDPFAAVLGTQQRQDPFKSFSTPGRGNGSSLHPNTTSPSYYGMPYGSSYGNQAHDNYHQPMGISSGLNHDFSPLPAHMGTPNSLNHNNGISRINPTTHTITHTQTSPLSTGTGMGNLSDISSPLPSSSSRLSMSPEGQNQSQMSSPSPSESSLSIKPEPCSNSSDSEKRDNTDDDSSGIPPKKRLHTVPLEHRDNLYWEKRKKNNESAKRSREARRMKEEQIALRVVYLEQENLQLRTEVSLLKSEIEKLRCMLYNS